MNIIFTTPLGSKLHRTSRPESDTDLATVYLPHMFEMLLGIPHRPVEHQTSKNVKNTSSDTDHTIMPLQHLIDQYWKHSPKAIDLVWSDLAEVKDHHCYEVVHAIRKQSIDPRPMLQMGRNKLITYAKLSPTVLVDKDMHHALRWIVQAIQLNTTKQVQFDDPCYNLAKQVKFGQVTLTEFLAEFVRRLNELESLVEQTPNRDTSFELCFNREWILHAYGY